MQGKSLSGSGGRLPFWPRTAFKRREAVIGYLFIAPLFAGLLIFMAWPLVYSLYMSFQEWSILGRPRFVGFDNYLELATDRIAWISLGNTLFLMLGIPIGPVISLGLALAMNRKLPGMAFFRTIYFLPVISSSVALAILWRWLLNPDFGLINYFLSLAGIPRVPWLGDPDWAKPALILMGVWGGLGFNMLLYLAALQNIPAELLDAAQIDGAGGWARFRYIIWPLVTPTTFFIFVTSVIGTFQAFANIHLMTRGNGPGAVGGGPEWSTITVLYYLWMNGFSYFRMGYASAVAWVLALIILGFTVVQFWVSRRWVHYGDE